MMKRVGLVLAAAGMTVLVAGSPAWADHLKAKKAHNPSQAQAVKTRLVELGATDAAASRQVNSLTQAELTYFAADTNRVQVVAGLWGEEWIVGSVFLGIIAGIALWITNEAND